MHFAYINFSLNFQVLTTKLTTVHELQILIKKIATMTDLAMPATIVLRFEIMIKKTSTKILLATPVITTSTETGTLFQFLAKTLFQFEYLKNIRMNVNLFF